jgi:hypothetical protein
MKHNPVRIRPFTYKVSNEEIISNVNSNLKIKVSSIGNIIDRVCIRYPFLARKEIESIILEFLNLIREDMITGRRFDLKFVSNNNRLTFYLKGMKQLSTKIKNKISKHLKVKKSQCKSK